MEGAGPVSAGDVSGEGDQAARSWEPRSKADPGGRGLWRHTVRLYVPAAPPDKMWMSDRVGVGAYGTQSRHWS